MIWKMHISVSVDAHLSGCLLMYINNNSLFICRGKKFPSVYEPVFRHTGIAQGSCGIISLGNSCLSQGAWQPDPALRLDWALQQFWEGDWPR